MRYAAVPLRFFSFFFAMAAQHAALLRLICMGSVISSLINRQGTADGLQCPFITATTDIPPFMVAFFHIFSHNISITVKIEGALCVSQSNGVPSTKKDIFR